MLLREHASDPTARRRLELGMADLMPWLAFVRPGVVLNKDWSVTAAWDYRGPDVESATAAELEALSSQLNTALRFLGSNHALHVDAIRRPVTSYLPGSFGPEVARWLDEERRERFGSGAHYETLYRLAITWGLPTRKLRWFERFLTANLELPSDTGWDDELNRFESAIEQVSDLLASVVTLRRLDSEGLARYLHACATGLDHPIRLPARYLGRIVDHLLGDQELAAGYYPRIGKLHFRILGIEGLPDQSFPGILDRLNHLPLSFRWSTRFLPLDPDDAKAALSHYRRLFAGQVQSIASLLSSAEEFEKERDRAALNPAMQQRAINRDAVAMVESADSALKENAAGRVRFGYLTTTILVWDEDPARAADNAREVLKEVRACGFGGRLEEFGAMPAWRGSLPGFADANPRRPIVHTLNLADLLPTTALWTGSAVCPSQLMPAESPALALAEGSGSTPFYLNLHHQDVGHTLILGPTGTGKSTLLGFLIAQFFRYPNARVYVFDKGYSAYVLTQALGGVHYDLKTSGNGLSFAPLAHALAEPTERQWAAEWLEQLYLAQGLTLSADLRRDIWAALDKMTGTTLYDVAFKFSHQELRHAIAPFLDTTAYGPLFNSPHDNMADSHLSVFEMSTLAELGGPVLTPALLYLFHAIERRLDGSPTLLVLDEAWTFLLRPLFADRIRQWLKELRKKNAAVVFASQSLADVLRSEHSATILESCPTKILLANPEALTPQGAAYYDQIGLNERQRELVAKATPKRHYYLMSPSGRRLFELKLGPLALSFVAAGGPEDLALARSLNARYGASEWTSEWLRRRGLPVPRPAVPGEPSFRSMEAS